MKFTPSAIRTTANIGFRRRTFLASTKTSPGISRFYQSFARLTRPRFELLLGMGTAECQIRAIVRGQVFVSGTNFPHDLHYAAGRARGCVLVVAPLAPPHALTARQHR